METKKKGEMITFKENGKIQDGVITTEQEDKVTVRQHKKTKTVEKSQIIKTY